MSPASYQTAPPRVGVTSSSTYSRAGNGTRTRDPNLGKVVLYQLSYSRIGRAPIVPPGTRISNSSPGSAAVKVEARGIEPLTS